MIAQRLLMFRLARRYISRRWLQSVLFVLGVALGVAVGVAIDLANESAKSAFTLSAESISGRTTHQVMGGPSGLPSEVYRQLRVDLGLRQSAPIVEAFVRADDLGDQPLRLLGVDPFAEAPFRDYLTTSEIEGENQIAFDALNLFLTEPNTILVSAPLAAEFDITPGQQITLQRPDASTTAVRVAGLLQPGDSFSGQALETLLLADIATAQELLGQPGQLSRIDLILPDSYDTRQITSLLPPGAYLTTPNATNSTLTQMTAAFELNLRALSLLALVVGGFLIYNTVTFSVVQRRPMIGVMRSLGATRRQIFTLILGEAILLGLLGTVLGLALGIIMGRAVVGLIAQTISDLYFAVTVERVTLAPGTLLTGAAIGLTASLVAAIVPSWEATRTPPAGTLRRSENEQRARGFLPYITGGAVLLNALGVVALSLPTQSLIISFTALFLIVVGCALLTPLALVAGMQLVTPLSSRVLGVVGRLAPRGILRAMSRTSIAVAALTVAVSVIVGVGVMIASFRTTVSDWLATTLGADVYVSTVSVTATRASVDLDPALRDLLAGVVGVESVPAVRNVSARAPDYPDLPPVNLAAVTHDLSEREGGRRFVWNNAPDGDYWAALQDGQIVVSEPFAFRRGITPDNDTLTLLTDRGEETLTIAGVYYDYTTDQGTVLVYDDTYRALFDDPYYSSLAIYVTPGTDIDALIEQLRTETLVGQDLTVRSNRALRESALEVFDRTFSITVALQALATLVAFIGILSALMAQQLEHAREYAIMRANGLTPRQMWQVIFVQTGLMGGTAGLLAAPIGLALAVVLIEVINVRSFGWSMQLTLAPVEFAQAFVVALGAALLAGVYPAWRLGRMAVTEGLRME